MASKIVEALDLPLVVRVMRADDLVSFRAASAYRRAAFTLSGCRGEARLMLPGDGGRSYRRPVLTFLAPNRVRLAKAPYNGDEQLLIERGLRLLDRRAKLRFMSKRGTAVVVRIFGGEVSVLAKERHTITLPEAELPEALLLVARDLGFEVSPSPADSLEGVLF